jgi:ribokinase
MTRKTDWDIVVVGGANTDYLVSGPTLPKPGETIEGNLFQEAAGGKGANQAVAASRLGARVALVTCLGKDSRGDAILATLSREGVETRHGVRTGDAVTGMALVTMVTNQAPPLSLIRLPQSLYQTNCSGMFMLLGPTRAKLRP